MTNLMPLMVSLKAFKKRFSIVIVAFPLLFLACNREISGSYLVSDQQAVCWLQLVRTPDNRLNGQMNCSTLNQDGSIKRASLSVAGSVNGNNLSLAGGGLLGLDQKSFSGIYNGNSLILVSENSTPVTFNRSDVRSYQASLEEQAVRSRALVASLEGKKIKQQTVEKQKETNDALSSTLLSVHRFNTEATMHLQRMSSIDSSYSGITARITEYISRENRLADNPALSVARSNLHLNAQRLAQEADNIHQQVENLKASFSVNIEPLRPRVEGLIQFCRRRSTPQIPVDELNSSLRDSGCRELLMEAPAFERNYNLIVNRFKELDSAYNSAEVKQKNLLASR